MKMIRSLLFYIILFLSTIYIGTSAIITYYITRDTKRAHLCGKLWGKINLWVSGVSVEIEGLENIDPAGSYIFAANHQSWFDIFAIYANLPIQFHWLAKEELFRIPVLGASMRATGAIPIDRTDRRKAFDSLNEAAKRVREGASMVIFPEGTRSSTGALQDFKTGGFILAIKAGQPIVPITISGSHLVLPKKGTWQIQPRTIRMTIGQAIPTADCTVKDRDRLMAMVREAIREHLPRREGGLMPDSQPRRAHTAATTYMKEHKKNARQ